MPRLLLLLLSLLAIPCVAADPAPRAEGVKVRIVLVGDSTVAPNGGWGPGFAPLWSKEVEVINWARPGRSSKSFVNEGWWAKALAARHRIALNRIGGPVHITTGRQLAKGMPGDDVVVMLDGECAFRNVTDDGVEIFWGAYVGTADEILVAGKLAEHRAEIERIRTEARTRHGWIMDTYLLRKT